MICPQCQQEARRARLDCKVRTDYEGKYSTTFASCVDDGSSGDSTTDREENSPNPTPCLIVTIVVESDLREAFEKTQRYSEASRQKVVTMGQ